MISLHPQFIKDNNGKNLVILLQKDYDLILEQLEELEDIRKYDKAKKKKQVFYDADTVFSQIESKRNTNVSIKN
jgi:hypothetical protein